MVRPASSAVDKNSGTLLWCVLSVFWFCSLPVIGESDLFLCANSFNFKCGEMGDLGKFPYLKSGPATPSTSLLILFPFGPVSVWAISPLPSPVSTLTLSLGSWKLDPHWPLKLLLIGGLSYLYPLFLLRPAPRLDWIWLVNYVFLISCRWFWKSSFFSLWSNLSPFPIELELFRFCTKFLSSPVKFSSARAELAAFLVLSVLRSGWWLDTPLPSDSFSDSGPSSPSPCSSPSSSSSSSSVCIFSPSPSFISSVFVSFSKLSKCYDLLFYTLRRRYLSLIRIVASTSALSHGPYRSPKIFRLAVSDAKQFFLMCPNLPHL